MTEPELPAHWSQLEPFKQWLDDYDRHVMGLIDSYGWMVQGVFPSSELDPGPSFAYTVGLAQYDHPEFIVFSLAFEVAHTILNSFGEAVKAGEIYSPGPQTRVLRDLTCYLLEVEDTREYLTMANRLYPPEVRALQLVWPDQQDRLPWEAGYAIDPGAQPILGQAPQ